MIEQNRRSKPDLLTIREAASYSHIAGIEIVRAMLDGERHVTTNGRRLTSLGWLLEWRTTT